MKEKEKKGKPAVTDYTNGKSDEGEKVLKC